MPPSASDGQCLRDLFTHPEQWKETRSEIDVLGYADHVLNKQFTDEQLRAWLPLLNQWHLKLGLEVGAVKPWAVTGRRAFDAQRPMWDRFGSLGGPVYALAMDEPLCCVEVNLKKPVAYAVEETAQFIALVREHCPDIRVGDIEPYPSISLAELTAWLDALEAKLKQLNVRGLDFFRLDVDWCHFTIGGRIHPGNWPEVKKLEDGCRQGKIASSLVYWAADYPALDRLKLADDSTWYVSVMRQGNDYAFVGGAPGQITAPLAVAVGILICFWGHRLLKLTSGVMGFIAGAGGGWTVGLSLATGNDGIGFACAVIGGVIGAALCLWLFFLGIFLLGASAGAILATALFSAAGNQPQAILLVVFAIVFGVIALLMQKLMIVVSTALSGAYLVAAGLLHLLTGAHDASVLWFDHLQPGSTGILGYVALVFWLGLGLAGGSFQCGGRRRREEATRNETRPA